MSIMIVILFHKVRLSINEKVEKQIRAKRGRDKVIEYDKKIEREEKEK